MSTEFTVPYPPQANHMYTVARGRKIKSTAYRTWTLHACMHIQAQRVGAVAGHYHMDIVVPRPDRRGRDIDNLMKPLSDAIASAGVISNDNLAMSVRIAWASVEPTKGDLVRVRVWPHEPQAAGRAA